MPVFISHAEEDKPLFTMLKGNLKGVGIETWDPEEMEAGKSLADQLRAAIHICELCVFLVTKRSIRSQWCLAEVGAFWGAGKQIVTFLADPDVKDEDIPAHLQADLTTRLADPVIRSAVSAIEAEKRSRQSRLAHADSIRLGQLSLTALPLLVASASSANNEARLQELALLLRLMVQPIELGFESNQDEAAYRFRLLESFVGSSMKETRAAFSIAWAGSIRLKTTSGNWEAYYEKQRASQRFPFSEEFGKCVMVHFKNDSCTGLALVSKITMREEGLAPLLSGPDTIVGEPELGEPLGRI